MRRSCQFPRSWLNIPIRRYLTATPSALELHDSKRPLIWWYFWVQYFGVQAPIIANPMLLKQSWKTKCWKTQIDYSPDTKQYQAIPKIRAWPRFPSRPVVSQKGSWLDRREVEGPNTIYAAGKKSPAGHNGRHGRHGTWWKMPMLYQPIGIGGFLKWGYPKSPWVSTL